MKNNDSGKIDAFVASWTFGLASIAIAGLAYVAGSLGIALILGAGGVGLIGLTWTRSTFSRVMIILVIAAIGLGAVYAYPRG